MIEDLAFWIAATNIRSMRPACWLLPARAQRRQLQQQEDPEDDKKLGLWLDQTIRRSTSRSPEFEIRERLD
jgi:hypothetical protein